MTVRLLDGIASPVAVSDVPDAPDVWREPEEAEGPGLFWLTLDVFPGELELEAVDSVVDSFEEALSL